MPIRIVAVVLLVVAILASISAVAQAMFAGKFIAGDYDAMDLHALNAIVLTGLSVAVVVLATTHRILAGGSWWPILASSTVVGAEGISAATAESRILEIHVPLGVLVIVTLILLTVWIGGPVRMRSMRRPRAPFDDDRG